MPTITIDLTAQQAQRLQDALSESLGQPATVDDAKTYIKIKLRQLVQSSEKRVAEAQAAAAAVDFDPTVT